jgi:hypothetical protein
MGSVRKYGFKKGHSLVRIKIEQKGKKDIRKILYADRMGCGIS